MENEDANEYVEKILELADLVVIENMTFDQLMLIIFPLSLSGTARRWLNDKPMESITNWIELQARFLGKFGPIKRDPEFTCWLKSKFGNPDKMSISLKKQTLDLLEKGER